MTTKEQSPRVLLIYYSFSSQTKGLINRLAAGLVETGVEVFEERLQPVKPLRFPIGSILATFKMMLVTFFRQQVAIEKLSGQCYSGFDLIILAGPTWSYNPSGPVLSLFRRDGGRLFAGQTVLPLISCRGYWRTHWYSLKLQLKRCGATVPNVMVFSHPCHEPWRTIGVFLKLAGKNPELSLIGKRYPRYGHDREQQEEAYRFGILTGKALSSTSPLSNLDFRTRIALP